MTRPQSTRDSRLQDRRHAFDGWLQSLADGPSSPSFEMSCLAVDAMPLPDDVRRRLGLPAGTRYADAVAILIWASDEGCGPRCRSLRAAAYFVAGLDEDTIREFLNGQ